MFSEAYEYGAKAYFKKDKNAMGKITQFVKDYITPKPEKSFFEKLFGVFKEEEKTHKIKDVAIIEDDKMSAFAIEFSLKPNTSPTINRYTSVSHFLVSPIKKRS